MSNESETMREIHEIRRQIYEETKHMTPEERANTVHREATEALKAHGLERMVATASDVLPNQRRLLEVV